MELGTEIGCCAVQVICELNCHDSPEEAMHAFCAELVIDYGPRKGTLNDPGAFIIFTGVVRSDPNGPDPISDVSYGPNFRDYIRQHNLGIVRQSVGVINRLNHRDHIVRVWVWAPDVQALKQWYSHHKKEGG